MSSHHLVTAAFFEAVGRPVFFTVGVLACLLLALLMCAVAVAAVVDAVTRVKRHRARVRFSREALTEAQRRLAAQQEALTAAAADEDRRWAAVYHWPELRAGR